MKTFVYIFITFIFISLSSCSSNQKQIAKTTPGISGSPMSLTNSTNVFEKQNKINRNFNGCKAHN